MKFDSDDWELVKKIPNAISDSPDSSGIVAMMLKIIELLGKLKSMLVKLAIYAPIETEFNTLTNDLATQQVAIENSMYVLEGKVVVLSEDITNDDTTVHDATEELLEYISEVGTSIGRAFSAATITFANVGVLILEGVVERLGIEKDMLLAAIDILAGTSDSVSWIGLIDLWHKLVAIWNFIGKTYKNVNAVVNSVVNAVRDKVMIIVKAVIDTMGVITRVVNLVADIMPSIRNAIEVAVINIPPAIIATVVANLQTIHDTVLNLATMTTLAFRLLVSSSRRLMESLKLLIISIVRGLSEAVQIAGPTLAKLRFVFMRQLKTKLAISTGLIGGVGALLTYE